MNRFLHDLSVHQLYVSSLILIIVSTCSWWYFLYNPLSEYCHLKDQEIDILEAQLSRSLILQGECDSIESACNVLKKGCSELTEKYYLKEPQVVLQGILECASNHKLYLESCETYKGNNNVFGVLYNIKSSYENFFNFLLELELMGYDHQLNSCIISRVSESEIKSTLTFEFSSMDHLL